MKHIIIGTAGHIDHGKTTLIKALTGRDTDTLKEEKERGISINLGFTYFDLPSGRRAGIVDVPGHERFIKNMLAGASGIDIVLLVIAADEGIMPQTREHFNILSLLNVKKGLVVVTKKDMVDSEWLDVVIEDIQKYLKGTFLEDADIIPVSSVTRDGMGELAKAIDILASEVEEKSADAIFRLPVDRVFTISGFGTVVTGTLISGMVSEGDKVIVYPGEIETKVRNIQVHEQPVKSAYAGQRVAINLANVKVENIERGDILSRKGDIAPSLIIDCRLYYLKDAERNLENRDRVRIYHGTSEIFGRVIILDKDTVEPGDSCLAQVRLESPISALNGDRFVIRAYSPMVTIGGGVIIDPNPVKRKRYDSSAINELLKREKGNPDEVIEHILQKNSKYFPDVNQLAKLTAQNENEVRRVLGDLKSSDRLYEFQTGDGIGYTHSDFIRQIAEKVNYNLKKFHEANPLKLGMSKEEIKSRIFEGNIKQRIFDSILQLLEQQNIIRLNGKYISLYGFDIRLSPVQNSIKDTLIKLYDSSGISGIKYDEAIASFPRNIEDAKMVFELMTDNSEIIKISEDTYISKNSYEKALNSLKEYFCNNKEITLAQYRDILDTSRKSAVSLLEYFDQIKITKRLGDKRVLI